jgi:magnesium-transporting ATPase (P-type)
VFLDGVQEHRAEQAAERLKISVALSEQVLRDGREITVRAEEIVPGDVVLLAAAISYRPTAGSSKPGIFSSTRRC